MLFANLNKIINKIFQTGLCVPHVGKFNLQNVTRDINNQTFAVECLIICKIETQEVQWTDVKNKLVSMITKWSQRING